MRYSSALLGEIRDRLPISGVVGRRVVWDRRKSQPSRGDYWACCPFHAEKTPSFHVDDRRGIYKCFGCGASGDHFKFLCQTEGLTFPEAVERLAQEAGVAIPAPDPKSEAVERRRAGLGEIVEAACRFFEAMLAGPRGRAARAYLDRRGITPQAAARFRLGLATDERAALKEHLAAKGYAVEDMIAAGLVVGGADVPVAYDRFRDRIIFPITDLAGRVVGFGGRAMRADAQAKYLNSPETPLFHKGRLLYNGRAARAAARAGQTLIVVEGYVDVIAAVNAGFEATVAPLGTALTEEQLGLLWRMAEEPVLCFDGDAAGLRAAHRAADLALPRIAAGRSLRFALLPAGQDPDDLIREGGGASFASVIAAARPLVDVLWTRETEGAALDTPERRAALEAKLRSIAAEIRDEGVRRHYLEAFSERLAGLFGTGRITGRNPYRRPRPFDQRRSGERRSGPAGRLSASPSLAASALVVRGGGIGLREAVILGTMINHPDIAADHGELVAELDFPAPSIAALRSRILSLILDVEGGVPAPETIRGQLAAGGFADLIERIDRHLASNARHARAGGDRHEAEAAWLQAVALHRRAGTLHKELRSAEAAFANDPSDENLARLNDIRDQLSTVGDGDAQAGAAVAGG